jgi:hypothetical protein
MPNTKTKKKNYKNLTKLVLKEKRKEKQKTRPKKSIKQSKKTNYKQLSKIVLQDMDDMSSIDEGSSLHIESLDIPSLDTPSLDTPSLDRPSMDRSSMDINLPRRPELDSNRYMHMYKHNLSNPPFTNKHRSSIYDKVYPTIKQHKDIPFTPSVTYKQNMSMYNKKLKTKKRENARKIVKDLREKQKKRENARKIVKELREKQKREISLLKKKKREEAQETVRKLRAKQKKELLKITGI